MGRRGIAHRSRIVALVGAAVLALTGCVGIPSSGSVQVGDVINADLPPDIELLPDGPTPGSDPTTLLTDFMQAVQSPANNFAIAKEFLTPSFATTWEPNAQTTIRGGGSEIVPGTGTNLVYRFSSGAFVDDLGHYFEQPMAPQQLEFSFEQVAGEWRISAGPDGIVLTENGFDVVFRAQPLYFFDPAYSYLVPDVRWVPERATTNNRVVGLLLAGPSEWLAQSVVNAFPEGTTLETDGVSVEGTTATVALSGDAARATEVQLTRVRQQLAVTLGVASVVLSIGGGVGTSGATSTASVNPQVDGTVLIGTGGAFGYPGAEDIVPVTNLSSRIVASGADAVSVFGQRIAAFRAERALYLVSTATDGVTTLLPDLTDPLPPSLDPYGFVWAVPGQSAAGLTVYRSNGEGEPLANGLSPDSRVTSMEVSRDGARLLVATVNAVGQPELAVYGIIRGEGNVPIALGSGLSMFITGEPVDTAWVDDTHVIALVATGGETVAIQYQVGGPSTPLGAVPGAIQVVGGNGGNDGVRILRSDGEILQLRGRTWQLSGLQGTFLGVQQGRDR